ncbi:peroxisomal membrane 22 kDa (Mpv17/PMP22) family protein [Artemisia annua]|uniref:Peroxisomal membrane 22 kDa (Mpv17/PMP22) family protein n=1 Tax=Artemisia annua TaxID=35608 RepID=A0A2U1NNZ8_ARTAN|nr:peroxisomal membrane 22 kDa (Mpv17/PMP22) family protein [Artemisia annua]
MNTTNILRNIHHLTKHSISNVPINRTHVGQLHLCSRFLNRRTTREIHFPVVRRFSSGNGGHKVKETTRSSIANSGPIVWYLGMINARPILTKSITSAVIYTAADLTSQTMTQSSSEPFNFIRTCRMAGYGAVFSGPTLHFWFNFVSRVFPKKDLISTFKKMFMGQFIYGPIMTAVFFSVNAALQGERGKEIMARLKRDMVPTMINNVIYWPLCDFITFRFVPVHLQTIDFPYWF